MEHVQQGQFAVLLKILAFQGDFDQLIQPAGVVEEIQHAGVAVDGGAILLLPQLAHQRRERPFARFLETLADALHLLAGQVVPLEKIQQADDAPPLTQGFVYFKKFIHMSSFFNSQTAYSTVSSLPSLSSSSSSSSFSASRATATTFSFSSVVISLTPWVLRPMTEQPETGTRRILPLSVMTIRSWSSATCMTFTTGPLRSVVLMVMMPLPPRLWSRYSSRSVRLP